MSASTNAERSREYLTVPEVAMMLGVSAPTIRRRVAEGELRHVKLGAGRNSAVRISRTDLAAWLDRHAVEPRSAA
jgi:excisionase family DNA binding protein